MCRADVSCSASVADGNQEEIENHRTVFATRMQKMREQIEAMKAIWTDTKPEYCGELVKFGTIMTWPKPVQKPHPPVILGGAFPWAQRVVDLRAPEPLAASWFVTVWALVSVILPSEGDTGLVG